MSSITVTLKAILEPGVSEDQQRAIAERLENYVSDAVKYVDGVESASTAITAQVFPPLPASEP